MLLSTEVAMYLPYLYKPRSCQLRRSVFIFRRFLLATLLVLAAAVVVAPLARAQAPTPPPAQPQQPDQTAPDAGGPTGDSGVIALPKKKDATDAPPPPPAPAEPKVKNPEGMPTTSIRIEVPEVSVDVGV